MTGAPFSAWSRVPDLPDRAPVRSVRPDALPRPPHVRARLAAEGVDPAGAGAVIAALFARGWAFWLVGSPHPQHFAAFVLEPRFGAPWAEGRGATPAEALGAVLVACLDNPPWGADPDEPAPGGEG